MAEGESIDDLLKKSGGYTSNAYPFGAVYETEQALLINRMAKDILYEEFIDNIITYSKKILWEDLIYRLLLISQKT